MVDYFDNVLRHAVVRGRSWTIARPPVPSRVDGDDGVFGSETGDLVCEVVGVGERRLVAKSVKPGETVPYLGAVVNVNIT